MKSQKKAENTADFENSAETQKNQKDRTNGRG